MSDAEIVRDVLTRATNETATKMLPVDVFLDASLALDRLESQNQALQEALQGVLWHIAWARGEEPFETAFQLLSPTRETDPE